MTDLEKQVMQKREVETAVNRRRARIEDAPRIEANFFGTGDTSSKSISAQLKDFDNKYKPTDLTAMFSETLTKSEAKKAETEVKQTFSTAPKALPQQKPARDPYATPDEEFVNITRMGNMPSEATYEVPVDTTEFNKSKFGIKLNLKGKLVIMVASVVFLCLLFLAIFNACVIGNLNGDIAELNSQITTESELVDWIKKSYDSATDETNLLNRVEDAGFSEIPPENIIEFELLEEEAASAAASSSNWFDAFCDFMSKLFGAN